MEAARQGEGKPKGLELEAEGRAERGHDAGWWKRNKDRGGWQARGRGMRTAWGEW